MDVIVMDKLEDIASSIEYNRGGINTLLENALLNAGSVVKSVQRGTANITGAYEEKTTNISIGTVNVSKSVLIVNSIVDKVDWGSSSDNSLCFSLQSGKIVCTSFDFVKTWIDWQVVEFY